MGRSAKVAKRPTKKEKSVSKTTKASQRPLSPPPPPPPAEKEDDGVENKAMKKRRMLRAKAEKKLGKA